MDNPLCGYATSPREITLRGDDRDDQIGGEACSQTWNCDPADWSFRIEGGEGGDTLASLSNRAYLDGGPGDDRFVSGYERFPRVFDGGPGADRIEYFSGGGVPAGYRAWGALNISLDGVANDGNQGSGIDNVLPNVESILGGAEGDILTGGVNADDLDGRGGNDTIDGKGGPDNLHGADGDDRLIGDGDDGASDEIFCGPGNDTVRADANDVVAPDCENVTGGQTVTQISLDIVGSGAGTVRSVPAGFDTRFSTSAHFAPGSRVTLTATPDTGSTISWGDGPCLGTVGPSCTVTAPGSGSVVQRISFERAAPRYTILSIGDSVASGEGNPTFPRQSRPWIFPQCHRSHFAGPAQAVDLIEASKGADTVNFFHLACSGGKITTGLLGPYRGIETGPLLRPQLDEIVPLGEKADAVLISVGANDLGFSKIVKSCAKISRVLACSGRAPGRTFRRNIRKLPGRYGRLAAELRRIGVPASKVYITEYFDPTRDGRGRFCDSMLGHSIERRDAKWASDVVLKGLNRVGREAAKEYGWHYVGGIASGFRRHGYCARDHWVVRFGESRRDQGDIDGTLHPNRKGQRLYARQIAKAVLPALGRR